MSLNKVASTYPSVHLSGETRVEETLRELGGKKRKMSPSDFPEEHPAGFISIIKDFFMRVFRKRPEILSRSEWMAVASGWGRILKPVYLLAVLCAFLFAGDIYLWISRNHDGAYQRTLTNKIRKLETDKQVLAMRVQTLSVYKKDLETKVEELTKNIAETNSQFESVKTSSQQTIEKMNAKDDEIMRLNGEVSRLNGDIEQYKQASEEMAGNLSRTNAAYEELKQKLLDLSNRKKISDKNAKKFLKDLAEEDQPASLGVAVIKG